MPTVYRIERNGLGPYRADETNNLYNILGPNPHADLAHPSKGDDLWGTQAGARWEREENFILQCACPCPHSLARWFRGCILPLYRFGFAVYEIQVKEYYMGESGRQCFFEPHLITTKKRLTYAAFCTHKSRRKVLETPGR